MTELIFTSIMPVELWQSMGSDAGICKAARVSTLGLDSYSTEESAGLINFLMRGRHGSPFEHNSMTFRISAPIFVWREFMRHRIGVSYNEQSGRYMTLEPKFYVPTPSRPLRQTGKAGAYTFTQGSASQFDLVNGSLRQACQVSWEMYKEMCESGIAKEVARMCLPLNIFSSAYVTMNARSFMHFLSLRTRVPTAKVESFPQWEIESVALQMETYFRILFPLTAQAFDDNGRVAP